MMPNKPTSTVFRVNVAQGDFMEPPPQYLVIRKEGDALFCGTCGDPLTPTTWTAMGNPYYNHPEGRSIRSIANCFDPPLELDCGMWRSGSRCNDYAVPCTDDERVACHARYRAEQEIRWAARLQTAMGY